MPVVIGETVDRAVATGSLPRLITWVGLLCLLFLLLTTAYRNGAAAAHAGASPTSRTRCASRSPRRCSTRAPGTAPATC